VFLVLLATLVVCAPVNGQDPASSGDSAGTPRAEWQRCRQRADSLGAVRDRLFQSADSLALLRRAASALGDGSAEQLLLARGEALAESIRAVSAACLVQELRCERWGGSLPLRAEFPVPTIDADDPPIILRQKAGYARDLTDRIDRWMETIGRERQRIEERRRLEAEARQLLLGESLFDEQSPLGIVGAAEPGIPEDYSTTPGVLEGLMREMPGMSELGSPEEVLRLLEEWLFVRRDELVLKAVELEEEAACREREP
jgi:hypothetical protein